MQHIHPVILLLLLACSCQRTNRKPVEALVEASRVYKVMGVDTFALMEPYREPTAEERQAFYEQEQTDSLVADKLFKHAMHLAEMHYKKGDFILTEDTLSISYGNLFTAAQKHLYIRRVLPGRVYADVYRHTSKGFKQVCGKDVGMLMFMGDTIQDVNGDSLQDFLVHWYPAAGCCPRDIYAVYLQKANGTFGSELEFINPVFSPAQGIIRGLCYGHYAPKYKYRWNGFAVDTVEFIFPPDSANGFHYVRKRYNDKNARGQMLKEMPAEYKRVEDFM